tara:strand:+ start:473 stop:1084 length:612 start_codon:yes stop_codon:yes gene_type:complete
MSIVKLNNRSVKDITQFGSISSLGSLTHIATQTASSSASLSFTSGIDSTYKEYIFYFVNIHPASDGNRFLFQGSTNSGSGYGVNITSTFFKTFHNEAGSSAGVSYDANNDLANSTSFQQLNLDADLGADNDQSLSGQLRLFNPSSTTFVKHFIGTTNFSHASDFTSQCFIGGYFNSTSAINAVQFKMNSGNIDSGQILLFGLN